MINCIKPNDFKPNGIKPSDHLPCPERRNEAKRSDVPFGHVSMLLLGKGSEATEPYNKYDKIRPHSIRSLQFDQKVRPLSFRGRDISSPAIWAIKISAHFGDNNVAKTSHQICSHTHSALNAGAKRGGATCHMAMPHCCYLAKGAKRPSHTINMLTSLNISVN